MSNFAQRVLDNSQDVAGHGIRETKLSFTLRDLISFLVKMDTPTDEVVHQLRCPWNGELSSVEIDQGSFQGASMKVQFSFELVTNWIEYAKKSEISV